MPDFEHFRFSYSSMNPVLGESSFLPPPQLHQGGVYAESVPEPGYFLGDVGGSGPDGPDPGSLPPSGLAYLHLTPPLVLKTLNLRFRCFLAKVHELERRNKVLEKQLQQALGGGTEGGGHHRTNTKDTGVQTGFMGLIHNAAAHPPGGLLSSPLNPPPPLYDNRYLNPVAVSTDSNSNLTTSPVLTPPDPFRTNVNDQYGGAHNDNMPPPPPRFLPGTIWSFSHARRFSTGRESCVTGPGRGPWTPPDGVGVQIDTITPEIRALYNVLSKVKRERDAYKRRWEEEYSARLELQEKVEELEEDLQDSAVCQDELCLRVQQLKAELVLFKGLLSNNLSELDSQIQEKAMKVDMDICRRIDITARLCDVAQQRNCEDTTHMFQVATPPSTLSRRSRKHSGQSAKGGDTDELSSLSESEGGGAKDEEAGSTAANQINEQMQRMLNQLRESEFEDDCDSLAWEETEETLLLWEDFPGCTLAMETQGEDESIEKVINDTESLFKSREKELELANAKSDMNRHLHEYMEMCSMKRGLDVQMETCRRLITQTGDRYAPRPGGNHDPAPKPPLTWRKP
uniref:Intermediate filament family orphan 1 n=1 Tax=Sphaeramia orbicularis TaxID=375764 RepID=A0A673B333_9TELE